MDKEQDFMSYAGKNWQVDWMTFKGRVYIVGEDNQIYFGKVIKNIVEDGRCRMVIKFDEKINPRGMEEGAWLNDEWALHPRFVWPERGGQ